MSKSRLKGKDLRKINFSSDAHISLALDIMQKAYKFESKENKLALLEQLISAPEKYNTHEHLSQLAQCIIGKDDKPRGEAYSLYNQPLPFNVFGSQHIDENTIKQMETAMRLPITVAGALMPDAHMGYGLPIGGVLATDNAVVPYAVGLDIGCRMALSVFDAPAGFMKRNAYQMKTALIDYTRFGIGKTHKHSDTHEVLDRSEFQEIDILKPLHGKAQNQLGSSGSGNHFAEFGTVKLDNNNRLGLPAGEYTGLLTHSGSRGLGASIAGHYTKLAIESCRLPKGAQHLAWLSLDSEAGQEYWSAMNLAGDYAQACHQVMHQKLSKALGLKTLSTVENHHNFAWKELFEGKEVIVHRKGATPANNGQLGVIPATMADPGYIVSGKGNPASLNSASHGAGRKMSRQKAKSSISGSDLRKKLKQNDVTLIGGGNDEAPMAYKNLEDVMRCQESLVNIEGTFTPNIVRMNKD